MTTFLRQAAWIVIAVALLACRTGRTAAAPPHEIQEWQSYKVAVLEFNPVLGDKQQNEVRLAAEIDSAFARGASLVVTPEMSNTGYHFDERAEIDPFVEPIPGPWTDRLAQLAAKHDAYVATSMPEVDPATNLYYISAVLIGPEGVVGTYRKNHLWQQEDRWAARGDLGIPVFETPLGNIAFNICMDTVFWEPARVAAIGGADILIVPTNSSGQTVSLFQALAAQNGIYVIGANCAGLERDFHMVGISGVWSPSGEPIQLSPALPKDQSAASKTSEVWATVEPEQARIRRGPLVAARQPDLYYSSASYSPQRQGPVAAPAAISAIALQLEASPGQVQENLARLTAALDEMAPSPADSPNPATPKAPILAVTPELAVTGPIPTALRDPVSLQALAKDADAAVPALAGLAVKHHIYLLAGTLRSTGSGYTNAALLFGPDGELLAEYAKTHLDADERGWLQAGAELGSIDVPGLGRLGILLGDEARVPELAGALAVHRVDVIAIPSAIRSVDARYVALPDTFADGAYTTEVSLWWDAVARFGQAYVIGANFVGSGYDGHSSVIGIDPIYGLDRPQVVTAGASGVAATIDLTRVTSWSFNQQGLIELRRPELYRALVSQPKE